MAASPYFAQYCTFKTADKTSGGYLLSADSLVGDIFDIVFETVNNMQQAQLRNRFGFVVGYFDPRTTHRLLLCQAEGWELHAILSLVLFNEKQEESSYWGEVAIMCFSPRYTNEFTTFMNGIAKEIRNGRRPAIDLKASTVESVIQKKGEWVPKDRETKFQVKPGNVIVKDHLKFDERLVEMARDKNIGCMIIGWAFIFAVIAFVIYVIWSILPF